MIAEAAGQAYLIPQRQQPQPQAPEQAPMQEPSPWQNPMAQPDQLAQVEGLTSNYYNAYSRLKDFTETMWKDYGLDVTKPDFTQQGGGNLHQAFQAMDADLRLAANDLSQHKKNTEMMNKLQAEGKIVYQPGYDPTKMLSTQMQPYQMYTPTDISEDVKLAVQGVSNQIYNTPYEAKKAFETLTPLISKYQNLIKTDPNNAPYYQRQIDALRKPTFETKTFNPYTSQARGQQNQAPIDGFIYHANLFKGNVDPSEIKEIKVIDGKSYGIIRPTTSLNLGKIQIDKGGKKYETDQIVDYIAIGASGDTYAYFKDKNIDPKRLDMMSADEVVRAVYENNPTYGKNYTQQLYQAAAEVSPTGKVDLEALMSPERFQTSNLLGQAARAEVASKQPNVDTLLNNIKSNVDSRQELSIGGVSFTPEWTLASTVGFTDEPKTYKLSLEDYKKLTGKKTVMKSDRTELTAEDIINLLKESGKLDEALNEDIYGGGTSSFIQSTPQPKQEVLTGSMGAYGIGTIQDAHRFDY